MPTRADRGAVLRSGGLLLFLWLAGCRSSGPLEVRLEDSNGVEAQLAAPELKVAVGDLAVFRAIRADDLRKGVSVRLRDEAPAGVAPVISGDHRFGLWGKAPGTTTLILSEDGEDSEIPVIVLPLP